MSASVAAAVRSSVRSAALNLAGRAKPKSSMSGLPSPSQKSLSPRIFRLTRSPVEMGSVSVVSMLPYHSATASALLNSMLSATPQSFGWTFDGS
ncbi:protein NUCLEAR FUSION DEFECTIVE 6, mitochondrial-like isoform X2 [Impatiens glandulifera]|uniref:protein NUCLEAR FUSION DEFECTIVE 6, mitochondrial-like isoform X2 n=1 Tax=Impatiens glandulifera TaxID=253017 RepID=UPI001FB069A5|nr:protein NUCLEAR FUSION DEFECTIVE 6, mitochondrial-like isoform X2 [Impatiens glandulifera]